MKPLKLKDFLSYQSLSNLKYAPGGKAAAFVVSTCNEEENTYESRLYLYDGEIRQLTDLGKEASYLWEDETHLLFPAVRSPKEKKRAEAKEQFTSYYRLDLRGGEAVHAFTLPFAVSRLEKLGDGYAAAGFIDANYPDYYKSSDEDRAKVAKAYEEEKDYEVLDEIPFWLNGAGMTNKQRTALFTVAADGTVTRITEPLFDLGDFCIKGDTLWFTGLCHEGRMPLMECDLRRLTWGQTEAEQVCHLADKGIDRLKTVGDQIWVSAADGKRHGINENSWVYRLNEETGDLSLLRAEEFNMYGIVGSDCRHGGGSQWEVKGGKLYHIATREDSAILCCLDQDGESTEVFDKPGSIDCIALCEERDEVLLVAMYDNRLQELYSASLETGEITRLSHFNDAVLADTYVADYQPLTISSCGESISGYVLLPMDYDPEKTYPAVLDIHGGPKTVYGPVFYHEMQLWASMGYFVFFCNPKGSDGRDNDFMNIFGHYGETDYQNLMDFTTAVLEKYPQINREKVCVTGGSYGGFMTNWVIGHTDRFCCAASQRSISNWLSFYGTSDIGYYFAPDQNAADFYEQPEILWAHSPIRYAKQVKTPTLFIHSDEDYRCPLEQGLQMYTALQDRGIPSRLCMFHGENHELSRSGKPRHRVRRLEEITNWFEKYAR